MKVKALRKIGYKDVYYKFDTSSMCWYMSYLPEIRDNNITIPMINKEIEPYNQVPKDAELIDFDIPKQ
jgi:hypothetical protein